MVIGMLGSGKSFLGNKALGYESFTSKRSAGACTLDFTAIDGPNFEFIDTPGLNTSFKDKVVA